MIGNAPVSRRAYLYALHTDIHKDASTRVLIELALRSMIKTEQDSCRTCLYTVCPNIQEDASAADYDNFRLESMVENEPVSPYWQC